MVSVRFVLLMLVITVLFSAFSYSLVGVFFEEPSYDDFCSFSAPKPFIGVNCSSEPVPDYSSCEGVLRPVVGDDGCVESFVCDDCSLRFESALVSYRQGLFLLLSFIGFLAVLVSLYFPSRSKVEEWVINGFLAGGLINLFLATVAYYPSAGRFFKPVILLFELLVIIFVAFKKGKK